MYGLKPVPFSSKRPIDALKLVPFNVKLVPFNVKLVPFNVKPVPFKLIHCLDVV
jgi:hypothetical protein